jgi:hypothetical protein
MARVHDTTVPPAGGSAADRLATSLVGRLVDVGIDGLGPLDPARVVADAALAETGSAEAAVDELVRSHTRLAAAGGFVTGLGGFVTLPVALPANVVGFYVVATRMVAGIAHLRGYDLARSQVRSAVLLALVGVDAEQVLARAGLRPLGGLRRLARRGGPQPAGVRVYQAVAFRVLCQAGRTTRSRLGRGVPLAGGVIGAGLDAWLLRRIAAGAREELAPV